jgi:hypothetical protein
MNEASQATLTDEQKQSIKEKLGIVPDSQLLSPLVDYIFKHFVHV